MAMSGESGALVPVGSYALMDGNVEEHLEHMQNVVARLGLSERDLDIITVPRGDGTRWRIETSEGTKKVETFQGVVVDFRLRRRFYKDRDFDVRAKRPPDCSSNDWQIGHGEPGGECDRCPFNEWASTTVEGSRAKACREYIMLFVILPAEKQPYVVQLPATSLKAGRKMIARCALGGKPYYGQILCFSLEQVESKFKYNTVLLETIGSLTNEEKPTFRRHSEIMGSIFSKVQVKEIETEVIEEAAQIEGPKGDSGEDKTEPDESPPVKSEPKTEEPDNVVEVERLSDSADEPEPEPEPEPDPALAEAEAEAAEAEAEAAGLVAKAAKAKAKALAAKAKAKRGKPKARAGNKKKKATAKTGTS